MSQKKETVFRARIRPFLDRIPESFWESISQRSIKGTPDIIGCIKGHFIALELKSSAKAAISAMQSYKLERISLSGGSIFIVYPGNWKETYERLLSI